MSSFAKLKKNREKQYENLTKKLNESKGGGNKDERFWKLTRDDAGNGSAIIRFLPPPINEDEPYVTYWSHSFKGPGGWYIENSLTTLGEKDKVGEENSRLWASGVDANKEIARKRKRKTNHVANILVVKDPSNPENDGKVFLYRFGQVIADMIEECTKPDELDDDKVLFNPFDLWEGANFRVRIRNKDDWPSYDKSSWDTPGPIGTDEEMEEIYSKVYPLKPFVERGNFKTYEELAARFDAVMGNKSSGPSATDLSNQRQVEQRAAHSAPAPSAGKVEAGPSMSSEQESPPWDEDEDDDELMARFRQHVQGD